MNSKIVCIILYLMLCVFCEIFEKNEGFSYLHDNVIVCKLTLKYCFGGIVMYYLWKNIKNIIGMLKRAFWKINRRFLALINNNPFWFSTLLIIVFWLPYLIAYSPGTAMWDTFAVLNNLTAEIRTAHHPIFVNMIMQTFIRFGVCIFHDEKIGMYIYIIIQYIFCSCSIGYLIKYLVLTKHKNWLTVSVLIFFSFLTIWPSYAVCMVKDTAFYAFFIVFNTTLANMLNLNVDNRKQTQTLFTISGIGLILFRNNGSIIFYFLIPLLLLWALFNEKECYKCKKIALLTFISLSIGISINTSLFYFMGYYRGGKQEMFSIPFQQTARVVKKYPNKILDEEKYTINMVLDYEKIAELYNPQKSDPVKSTYKFWIVTSPYEENIEKSALKQYFKTWVKMLIKYPGTYIEATFANTYGYFYIPYIGHEVGWYYTEHDTAINNGTFNLDYFSKTKIMRTKLEKLKDYLVSHKPFKYLYSCGLYSLILFVCFFDLYKTNRFKTIVLFTPSIVIILSCVASPVNAYIRYYLPILAVTPLMLGEMVDNRNY